jgi:acetyl-CoA synthetase
LFGSDFEDVDFRSRHFSASKNKGFPPVVKKERSKSYEEFVKNFHLEIPENFNFAFDFMDAQAKKTPHALAMIHVDNHGDRKDYDFAYFARESSKLAHGLAKLGVGRGDKVMLILYRRVEFWTACLALHKLGAVVIPASFLLTGKDIVERVNFASVKCVLIESTLVKRVDDVRSQCPDLKSLIEVGDNVKPRAGWLAYDAVCKGQSDTYTRPKNCPGGKDPMLIFFTSGTTGLAKMVEHNHEYPYGHVMTASYWHDLEPGDIHLSVADTGWGKAMWGKFYGQWMAGAVVFVYDFRDKFMPKNLLRIIAENKVSTFCAPPTVYRFLVREDFTPYDLSHLRHCTTAGEALNDSIAAEWKAKLNLSIYEGYGQTETTLLIATFPFMEVRSGSIGKPCPGWTVKILDINDRPCKPGDEGEICVDISKSRPLGLFDGYAKDPAKTDEVFRNGYYHTGDKAYADEDGYFWFLGRTDDVIKSAGYRIGPFEVESALISHEAVLEAAVTSVPDPVRGQAVKATIVLAPGYTPSPELTMELQKHVKKCTAPYKYPRIVEYVKELPKTVSGKIKRAEIRQSDARRGVAEHHSLKGLD